MLKCQGFAAHGADKKLEPYAFERRAVGAEDVHIDIAFCGVCHSDVHSARGEWGGANYPIVPGHEIVGRVVATGAQVKGFAKGDWVGVGCFVDSCRACRNCKDDLQQYCDKGMISTYNATDPKTKKITYGGYSNQIVVDYNYVLRMPKNLPADAAAPLLCAGITTYSPLKHWKAGPGKKVGVVGLGGLGHMAVKIACALGADVTVLSQSPKKKDDALKMGAHHFLLTTDEAASKKAANSFDLIINTVSAPTDWNKAMQLVARDGAMVMLGISPEPVPMSAGSVVFGRKTLAGSLIGGIAETQEMLDFCGKHNITCDIEKIKMEQINEAWDRMVRSDVRYRFVIDIQASKSLQPAS